MSDYVELALSVGLVANSVGLIAVSIGLVMLARKVYGRGK